MMKWKCSGRRGSWRRLRFLQDCGTEKWEFAVEREDYVIQNPVVWQARQTVVVSRELLVLESARSNWGCTPNIQIQAKQKLSVRRN
jgi:hypothetical protein